ncbi:hypothetical protein BD413DRAFT_44284 [Trametes elegans]|nr:hypothetical protein BD413DRAFT_44284 [Trametes elegans]
MWCSLTSRTAILPSSGLALRHVLCVLSARLHGVLLTSEEVNHPVRGAVDRSSQRRPTQRTFLHEQINRASLHMAPTAAVRCLVRKWLCAPAWRIHIKLER